MVPTPTVASGIYLAVAHGRGEEVLSKNVIKVRDAGHRWVVFQYPSDSSEALGTRGGGMLEMTINKCSGAILAHYSADCRASHARGLGIRIEVASWSFGVPPISPTDSFVLRTWCVTPIPPKELGSYRT